MNAATTTPPLRASTLFADARLAILLLICLLAAGPADAEPLPVPERIALPEEREVLEDLAAAMEIAQAVPETCIELLDRSLARLSRPTPLRGFVQLHRAHCLERAGRRVDAHEAVTESILLLPDHSGPLLHASSLYTYSDEPAKAADMLLRAIEIDPDTVRKMPAYELGALLGRLGEQNERERKALLAERLIGLGWVEGDVAMRSGLAESAIEARLERGDVEGARALVTKVLDPADAYRLLSLRQFEPLWPDIERWGGDRLGDLWHLFLGESRSAWRASRAPEAARDYAYALRAAGHERTIIREFMPLLLKPLDSYQDFEMIFVVSVVADSLAREGRWDEVEQLFAHTQRIWPMGQSPNALNLAANRARLLIRKGDMDMGVAAMDAALADARRWGGMINSGALGSMHRYRACALHALGRGEDAISSRAVVLSNGNDTGSIVDLYLCMDDPAGAREVMLRSLGIRTSASSVVALMQPGSLPPFASEYSRRLFAREAELKADPSLLEALRSHGRVMPYALSDGAPPEAR